MTNRWLAPWLLIALLAALMLPACSDPPAPPPSEANQAPAEPEAELATYRELLAADSHALAERVGRGIIDRYPDSLAAAEVTKTLEAVRNAAAAAAEANRLGALWTYHAVNDAAAGGTVRTAQIAASAPAAMAAAADSGYAAPPAVKLVLRDHPQWGRSAYLLLPERLPDCPEVCKIQITFDKGKRQDWQATTPSPEEPAAVFIEDYDAFLETLGDAARIEIRLPQTKLEAGFDVAGFDPARFHGDADKKTKPRIDPDAAAADAAAPPASRTGDG